MTAIRLPAALTDRLLRGARIGPSVAAEVATPPPETAARALYCRHRVTVYQGCPICCVGLRCGACAAEHEATHREAEA